MGWFSKVTSVVKKAALAPVTVAKLQARVAGKLLTAASKVAPSARVFGSATRATPAPAPYRPGVETYVEGDGKPLPSWAASLGARARANAAAGLPMIGQPAPAPVASSWFSTAAAALNPTTPILPAAAAAVPYGVAPAYPAPAPYAPAPYAPTYQPPPSSSGRGEIYSGDAYDPDATGGESYAEDGSGSQEDASLYDGGELGDATAIDYERHFSGAAGLAGWSDNLLSLAKGAASGALTTGAGILSKPKPPTAAELEALKLKAEAAKKAAGGIDTTTIAIAGGVGLVGLYLLTRKRGAPSAAVASNPRRRRRRSRR